MSCSTLCSICNWTERTNGIEQNGTLIFISFYVKIFCLSNTLTDLFRFIFDLLSPDSLALSSPSQTKTKRNKREIGEDERSHDPLWCRLLCTAAPQFSPSEGSRMGWPIGNSRGSSVQNGHCSWHSNVKVRSEKTKLYNSKFKKMKEKLGTKEKVNHIIRSKSVKWIQLIKSVSWF